MKKRTKDRRYRNLYVQKMKLFNFRNYSSAEIEFSKSFNVIYGNNAQGKTNILEAIFLCASGRSHRTAKDNELIKLGETEYGVELNVVKKGENPVIEIAYKKDEKKRVRINEIEQKKIGNLMGWLNAVLFAPEDLMIVKEGPSQRRRFLDITLSQLRPSYFFDLQQYMKILAQRNMLLKEAQQKRGLMDTLDIWNENMAKVGARIMKIRGEFIERIEKVARQKHEKITKGTERIRITYMPSVQINGKESQEEIEKAFLKTLERNMDKEMQRAVSLYGPQRDDYDIILDGKSTKIYGSQGQQRTAVLSMRLSEADIMKEETDEYPVLLLDDVMSELDEGRQECLMENLENIQVFVTCTDKNDFKGRLGKDARYYHINNGKVEE